jgi:hypothetical protein
LSKDLWGWCKQTCRMTESDSPFSGAQVSRLLLSRDTGKLHC